MLKNFINRLNNYDYLVLFIICCLGFWQIALFQNIMKWDILDINLPWRYFVSECLQNGILPLWNPYINSGFPQSADPMTWYPISWAIGFFVGNDLVTLQYEYLFHIFIGSLGVYKLGNLFRFNQETRIIIAISFMFSGLFVSNAQHLGWIVSAAWFPFIIYEYVIFSKKHKLRNGVLFILLLFFQLTGGYAGFFIITGYILLGLFIYYLIKYRKEKKQRKFIWQNVLLIITFTLLSSVVLVSSFEASTLLTRYQQLSMDYVHQGALPFKALVSFILPFATTVNASYWGTDLTLLNCYIGIIPMVFVFYSFIGRRKGNSLILFLVGVVILTVALADIFPFRKWLYYLPFMNIFRFPTIFRYFAYVIFLVVAGMGMDHFFKEERHKRQMLFVILTFIAVIGVFLIYNAFFIQQWVFKNLLSFNIKAFLHSATIPDRIFLQTIFTLSILTVFFVVIKRFTGKKLRLLIIVLVITDMIIATQLNIYQTVVDFASPKPTQQAIENLQEGFPLPDITEEVKSIDDVSAPSIPFLWRNLNIFHKKTTYTGYSPYYFSSMYKSETEGLFHSVIKNPLFYLADRISSNNIIDSLSIDTLSNKILITTFQPNKVELFVNTDKKQLLTFVQNYYYGWKAYVNDMESEIIRSNYSFMSIWVDQGENKIEFRYKPQKIIVAFYISAIILVSLTSFLVINKLTEWIRTNKKTRD